MSRRLAAVDIFSTSQWRAAVEHWGRRDANVPLRDVVGRALGVDFRALDALFDAPDRIPDPPAVDAVLADGFRAASAVPGGPVAFSLHVYSECLHAWEACADHRRIGAVIGQLPGAATGHDEVAQCDVWLGDDPQGRHYGGVTVVLPELQVTPYRESAFLASAEVRLSRLGNHFVRIETSLEDADLHTVNQALRRVSGSMGAESITDGTKTWDRLTEFAVDTIAGVGARLGTTAVESAARSYHVVMNARALAVLEPDGGHREATLADLPGAFGAALLLNPSFRAATSLEEWVRSPAPPVENLLAHDGLAGELCVRGAHSTLLWLPDAPDFLRQEYMQLAEFAASVPGLLHRWQHRLGEAAGELAEEMEALRPEAPDEASFRLPVLQDRELRVRVLEGDVRQLIAFLHSPNLVRSDDYRRFLDGLYAASSLAAQEHDLTSQLAVLAGQFDRVSTITSIILNRQAAEAAETERRREAAEAADRQRAEDKLRVALSLLGASSLGGVLNFFHAPLWIAIPALVVALAAIVLVSLPLLRRRPPPDR